MHAHDRQRRMFLRTAMHAGSALAAMPLIVAGCGDVESQPARAGGDTGPAAGPPAAGQASTTAAAQAGGTVPKAQAKYQDQPKGDQSCAKCQQFIAATSTCKVVEGRVSPQGWCMFWAKKS